MTTVLDQAPDTSERYERALPLPESLRPWITEIGHIPTLHELPPSFTHLPRAVTTIVLRTELSGRREALVLGPHTQATYAAPAEPAGCVRLRLAPGATHSVLGVPAAELTDRVHRLAELPGPAAALAGELLEFDSEDLLGFLEDALPQQLPDDPTRRDHRRLLESAVDALTTAPASITALASELAISERQLRNLFTTGIGVSPKHFARITRVRQLLTAAADTPWADRATAAGYYDQSHFAADFRAIMGTTPGRFAKGHLPIPTPCRAIAGKTA
ncbi:helix-turn-helix domain-containing protein [Nocardia yamanashiensis]|uniref:helix-turn-helix domain-containing protein n=1 Tax=Nocardia yamanashiensis TaxID=209247 RepID=UPI000AFB152F|nr:helix-turn-helix domain-containing protein [Nocardia yamanashiensis]